MRCLHCGYCPTCGRPNNYWNYPIQPYYPWWNERPFYYGGTTGIVPDFNPPSINQCNHDSDKEVLVG